MTLLAETPELWDVVFKMPVERLRFIEAQAQKAGPAVLDVGCATGMTCRALREAGMAPIGVDINARFIDTARTKDPAGEYHVGDMRTFQLSRASDLLICLGTTFSYNLTNRQVAQTLRNFHDHLRPGGRLVVDVVNAIAFTGAQPFRRLSRHTFNREGEEAVATIRHGLDLRAQTMTEQVTWRRKGHAVRKDPAESLRLLFPQELAFHLEVAGFADIALLDGWGGDAQGFSGRRLIALATRPG